MTAWALPLPMSLISLFSSVPFTSFVQCTYHYLIFSVFSCLWNAFFCLGTLVQLLVLCPSSTTHQPHQCEHTNMLIGLVHPRFVSVVYQDHLQGEQGPGGRRFKEYLIQFITSGTSISDFGSSIFSQRTCIKRPQAVVWLRFENVFACGCVREV